MRTSPSRHRSNLHSRRALAAGVLLLLAGAPASAREARAAVPPPGQGGGYDGRWVISASTSSFFCPVKHKQLVAEVRGGRVLRLSGLPGSASGQIGPDGSVTINLRVFGSTAHITGRIAGEAGGGQWTANNVLCSKGSWSAQAAR